MDKHMLTELLEAVQNGNTSIPKALEKLKSLPYSDLGYAKVDHHRALRNGFPEVIFCPGKSHEHLKGIVKNMLEHSNKNILATRADVSAYEAIREITDLAVYYETAKIVVVKRQAFTDTEGTIAVVCAGSSDIPVAEEAAVTSEILGNKVLRVFDVGVAGIHRLLDKIDEINKCSVIIVIAGMEGALASVLGGLTDKPLVGVPTSIGYGANFGGISALLAMLNSCASGIGVVNIDNGFGAACLASKINHLGENK